MSIVETFAVAITSMSPFVELRGSIPLGIGLGLDLFTVIIISIIFNSLVFFPIYFLSDFFYGKYLHKVKFIKNIVERIRKRRAKVDKYGFLGLYILVLIPLPMTGAWTGSILAWLLNLNWKKSFLTVLAGVITAGLIVSSIILGFITFAS